MRREQRREGTRRVQSSRDEKRAEKRREETRREQSSRDQMR